MTIAEYIQSYVSRSGLSDKVCSDIIDKLCSEIDKLYINISTNVNYIDDRTKETIIDMITCAIQQQKDVDLGHDPVIPSEHALSLSETHGLNVALMEGMQRVGK